MGKVQCIGRTNSKECLDCPHHNPHEVVDELIQKCSQWSRCDFAHNGRHSNVRCIKVKEG